MPEPIDLTTWRAEAPPSLLRNRIVGSPRRSRIVPRLAVGSAALAGIALVILFAGAPSNAAAREAKALVLRARRQLSSAPVVHLREYWPIRNGEAPALLRDLRYAEPGRWRVTSPKGMGGDRIFRRVTQADLAPLKGAPKEAISDRRMQLLAMDAGALGTTPEAVLYTARFRGQVKTMRELALQTEDFTVEGLTRNYFGDGASPLEYRDDGGGDGLKRVEVERSGVRITWLVDSASGRPMRASFEQRDHGAWHLHGRLEFDYPNAVDPSWFDPDTLADHG